MDALGRFGTSRLDRRQTIGEHRGKDLDHLPIAIVDALSLRRTRSRLAGSGQSLNGAPFRRAPGLRVSTGT